MLMSRNSIVLTGLAGLVGAVFLTVLCLWIMAQNWLPLLVTGPVYVWGIFLFLAVFSLVEIPVMVYSIGRIAKSTNPRAKSIALFTNAAYIFFGAVYAVPFILLTGRLGLGTVLASSSVIRFISSIFFLPHGK